MNIFGFRDYKELTLILIDERSQGQRGLRKELATAIPCQMSHLTNVLGGHGHFTLEQAERVCDFFELNEDEKDFYLCVVQLNRAGTPQLKKYFEKRLWEMQRSQGREKAHESPEIKLSYEMRSTFFSSWLYGAVLVLLTLPQFQNREALQKKLNVSSEVLDRVLAFLVENKLCYKTAGHFVAKDPYVEMSYNDPMISRFHSSWRVRALQQIETPQQDDLRYSATLTISEGDFVKVREAFNKALHQTAKITGPSSPEVAAVLCLDLFKL